MVSFCQHTLQGWTYMQTIAGKMHSLGMTGAGKGNKDEGKLEMGR